MKHKKTILQFLFGIVILIAIFYFVNPAKLINSITKVNWIFLVGSMLAYTGVNLILMLRLKLVFDKVGKKMSLPELFNAHMGGMLASDITPGRSGYMAVPFLLKDKVSLHSGFSAIFTNQLLDFFIKLVGSIGALVFLAYVVELNPTVLYLTISGILLVLVFTCLMAFALWSKKAIHVVKLLTKIPLIGKLIKSILNEIEEFQHEAKIMRSLYPQLIGLTLITWLLKGLEWTFIGLAMNFNLIFWVYLFIQPLITVLQFVIITPAGLGFQESGGLVVFFLLGVGAENAFLFLILARLVMFIPDLYGLPILIKKGVNIFDLEENPKSS
jgi:hypothetical protein